jgi:NAD(P)-dependent dehydrogenase (short-subunit alcohol dehydrogenase family)
MLVTLELVPLLRATAKVRGVPSRITSTSSITQVYQETLTKDPVGPWETVLAHWDDPKHFSNMFRYADSKLCVTAYCRKLSQLVSADEIIVNSFCPGLVYNKGLDRNLSTAMQMFMQAVRWVIGRSLPDAARTLVYAAVVVGKETHGTFLNHNQVHP